MIDTITLTDTLPRVFAEESIPDSEVWRRDVTFRRGKNYVIEAPSGTGKSSLCAYIYGNRRDYLGHIAFDGQDISSIRPGRWQLLRSHFPVGKMSIGQQQRVAIIRCVCQPFSFLLIDEPVSHLDAENNARAAEIIQGEATRQGAGIIATSVGNRIGIHVDELLHL